MGLFEGQGSLASNKYFARYSQVLEKLSQELKNETLFDTVFTTSVIRNNY